jgi:hypothetical protein
MAINGYQSPENDCSLPFPPMPFPCLDTYSEPGVPSGTFGEYHRSCYLIIDRKSQRRLDSNGGS